MSIIAAGTTTTTALSSTGNTDGTLQFQVNGTTASVTLNTLGAIGVGSTPSFGTSGQVLVSAGSTAAPAWATPAAVNLATGVTGTLPITNGGTGTTSTTFANLTTNVTGTLPIANGGTGTTSTTFANLATNVTGTLPIANGGTNSTATPTAGTVPYGTGTALAYTAVGTSGQVLQSNGASAPTWVAAGGGSWTYLSTVTASAAATADIETTFNSTYDMYVIVAVGILVSANNSIFSARLKIGGTYVSNTYKYVGVDATSSSTSIAAFANAGGGGIPLGPNMSSSTASTNFFEMYIPSPSSTTLNKGVYASGQISDSGVVTRILSMVGSYQGSQSALTGVRFYMSTGTLSGTFRLYGIKNS